MFLFRPFFKQPNDSNANVNLSTSPVTDPPSAKTVISITDNAEEGFASVEVRPFTYAEVAKLSIPDGSEVHRLHVPNGWNDEDEHDDYLEGGAANSLYNSTHTDINDSTTLEPTVSAYLRSPRKSASTGTNVHAVSELEYGDRVRAMKVLSKPLIKMFKHDGKQKNVGKFAKRTYFLASD